MINDGDGARDLSSLRVLRCGAVEGTGDPFEPYRVVDVDGVVVAPVAAYLRDLQACGRPAATQRSYAMDLLRWFRFLWAVDVGWDQATRVEARDFCRWIQLVGKPGGPAPDARYAPATVAHCETVLRGFYDFHLEAGAGPMVNPFPLARGRRGRANAHHNPMEPFRTERTGRYRPKTPRRIPRRIPDEKFDELFARLGSHRDRALVAFWVSTGARAAELLGARRADADPGQQLITVIRKGTRALQPLPASPDAFVWLRLYQQQMHGLVPAGPDDPLWWTLRRPFRPLTYHAARAMFTRAGAALGGCWRLHDLRHTAAYRMARDPAMPLTDVQWVLGHAHLSTTQLYTTAPDEDVIAAVVAHHARRERAPAGQDGAGAAAGYRPESLSVLFGRSRGEPPRPVRRPGAVTRSAGTPVYQGSRPLPADPAPSAALLRRFPPRPVPASWALTSQPQPRVRERLLAPPFPTGRLNLDRERRRGLTRVLDWLEAQPGDTWQDRWITSGADAAGNPAWRGLLADWLTATGRGPRDPEHVSLLAGRAIMVLICADVIRPSLGWLLAPATPAGLSAEMARVRDPAGFAALAVIGQADQVNSHTTRLALRRIAAVLAAKGGLIADITIGDCLELLKIAGDLLRSSDATSPYFYQLLRAAGVFGSAAPPGRVLRTQGQLSCEQLIDRYGIQCRPVRDLLVDYLRERQPAVDCPSLHKLSYVLGRLFWRDLELHHPGIASLHLPAEAAAAWKQRITTKTTRSGSADGDVTEANASRVNALDHLVTVRAFYLDLAQWAAEDPARWGPWAAPCPVRGTDIAQRGKERSRRKSRMDQRTRERIPVLPALLATVDADRQAAADRLRAAEAAAPGQLFTVAGQTLRRPARPHASAGRTWAQDPGGGKHRDLTLEEHKAFWTWAAVQVLRHTGRIEEMLELTHYSFVAYTLPTTSEIVPMLQVAPSKTDTERLLLVSPELAEVLTAVIFRVRAGNAVLPLVSAYDVFEQTWSAPMPFLFQRRYGSEDRPITRSYIRECMVATSQAARITVAGQPLEWRPHDFRRIFVTDALRSGLPPHIAAKICGHTVLDTTMGYAAIYPEDVVSHHRAFIARRRAERPSEEYRELTAAEWDEFLAHFELRKVALGVCGRDYGTPCAHENACVRCPLLRVDPAQMPRLEEIRANLADRLQEARDQGWLGEVAAIETTLAAAAQKLEAMRELTTRSTTVSLGMPGHPALAAKTAGRSSRLTPAIERQGIPHEQRE